METFTAQIFNLLVTPPGNLIYHLILAFSIILSLQSALTLRSGAPHAGRLYLGLSILLLAQIALFAASGLAWQQIFDPQRLLPPLDRAIVALSLLWMVWLWCYPAPNRLADAAVSLLTILTGVMAMFTVNAWLQQSAPQSFNNSTFDQSWQIFALVVLFIGLLVLMFNRPPAWGAGLIALGLLIAGYVASLLVSPSGDFSGILRLSHLCAFPLLPVLAQRLAAAPAPQPAQPRVEVVPARPFDPRNAQIWLQLAGECDPHKTANLLARAIAQLFKADLAFILTTPNGQGRWQLQGGYDLIADETLEDLALESDSVPQLNAALQRGRPIHLEPGEKTVEDLLAVARFLGLDDPGSLLAAPLIASGAVWGALVLFAPYSHPDWSDADRDLLASSAESILNVLQRTSRTTPAGPDDAVARLERELQDARQQIAALRQSAGAESAPAPDLEALLAVQKESQELITHLQAENERLSAAHAARHATSLLSLDPADQTHAEDALKMTLEELSFNQLALAEANLRIFELERSLANSPAAQFACEPVDLNTVVSQAVFDSSAIFREGSLFLQPDLLEDEDLPLVQANPEGLRLALGALLRSAASSAPAGSTLGLRLGVSDPATISIAIHSQGEQAQASIAALEVAGALIEAQRGELMVERQPSGGITYALRLPRAAQPSANGA